MEKNDDVVVATHAALFAAEQTRACDVCGRPVSNDDAGSGLYMWTRGDERRFEPVPLCASCAAAIGMTALARWEIEEDEG